MSLALQKFDDMSQDIARGLKRAPPDLATQLSRALGLAYLPLRGTKTAGIPEAYYSLLEAPSKITGPQALWVCQFDRSLVILEQHRRVGIQIPLEGFPQAALRGFVRELGERLDY